MRHIRTWRPASAPWLHRADADRAGARARPATLTPTLLPCSARGHLPLEPAAVQVGRPGGLLEAMSTRAQVLTHPRPPDPIAGRRRPAFATPHRCPRDRRGQRPDLPRGRTVTPLRISVAVVGAATDHHPAGSDQYQQLMLIHRKRLRPTGVSFAGLGEPLRSPRPFPSWARPHADPQRAPSRIRSTSIEMAGK
jgi:hypothetical protein